MTQPTPPVSAPPPGFGTKLDRLRPVTQRQGPLVGWLVTLAITALAGVLRFWDLGKPGVLVGDETFYAKNAWSLWHYGYVSQFLSNADSLINAGTTQGVMVSTPAFPVHPEVGKYAIGIGEQFFGLTPFGWRFSSAVAGTLIILLTIRLARRLTGSMFIAAVAGLLLTFDGLEFTMSRVAMLDIFLTLFLLAAVLCLVVDRDWGRKRLLDSVGDGAPASRWGPALLWRPWRLAAGVCFGLALGTKWSALPLIAAFGLVVVFWDMWARRALGVRQAALKSILIDAVPAFGYLVLVAFVVYLASWTGWLLHVDVLEKTLSHPLYGRPDWGSYVDTQAHGFFPQLLRGLRSLWHFQSDVYAFHTTKFTDQMGNSQQSQAFGWPMVSRPYWLNWVLGVPATTPGCQAAAGATCVRGVLVAGTPLLWWLGSLAFIDAIYLWIARRDWRLTAPIIAFLAAWLPWFAYGDRPIYYYYTVVMAPFFVVTVALVLQRIAASARRLWGRIPLGTSLVAAFVVVVIANFAWFWPVYTYQPLTHTQFRERVWFTYWEALGGKTPTKPPWETETIGGDPTGGTSPSVSGSGSSLVVPSP